MSGLGELIEPGGDRGDYDDDPEPPPAAAGPIPAEAGPLDPIATGDWRGDPLAA